MARGREDTQVLTVRMPKDVHEALRTLAFATDEPMNDIILRAVRAYLDGKGHREAVDALGAKVRQQYRVALDKLADL